MVTKVSGLEGVDKVKDGSIEFADFSAGAVAGIVSSGSNSNGNWTKFADGTMICTGAVVRTVPMTSSLSTGFFYGSYTVDFPATFATAPVVNHTQFAAARLLFSAGHPNTTTAQAFAYVVGAINETLAMNIGFTAIGRWK